MEQQKKYDIFISYSRKDFDEVNAFVEMLKQRIPTLEIWFDLDGIESGDEFRDKIISAIKRSKYVLFALSKNSDQSEWTRKELGFAKGKGIKIVPVLLRGAHLQEMDWFLFEFSGVDCIDIVDQKQIDKLIKNLAKWTQKELATLPPEESQKITAQPKVSSVQNTDSTSVNVDKILPKQKIKQWLWVLAAIFLIGVLGVLGWNQYEKQQEIIAKQHYDSVRLVQQQDSIKEFLRKDSIRVAREKQRQDSITKAQTAEKKRLERMRQDSIARIAQKNTLIRQIDTVYARISPYKPATMISTGVWRQKIKENISVIEGITTIIKSDTLWMETDTRDKYRYIVYQYHQYIAYEQLCSEEARKSPTFGLR